MRTGLFEDTATIRRITAEPQTVLGGASALLLQLAHPNVARGVAEHSDFKDNPRVRLYSTLDYLGMVVFGTKEEAHRIAWHAMRAHDRVQGPGYSAHDAELLTWVFATLYHQARDFHERLHGPLDPATAERLYQESVSLATLLGAPREAVPEDAEAFARYWAEQIASLQVGDVARGEAQAVLYPRQWSLRPAAPLNRLITAGLLPEPIRRQYGLRWSPAHALAFRLLVSALGAVLRLVPEQVRHLPVRGLVRVARRTRWQRYQGRRPVASAA
ncbi:oxygenase MpaB family protein [Actinocorallia aurea]